jgi:repressor LexA
MPRKDSNVLTKTQKETLDAIQRYISSHGESPTLSELAEILGKELPTIADRVRGLRKKGFITKEPHKWRNLKIVDRHPIGSESMVQIPMVASVGADNMAVFAQHEFDQFLQVQQKLLNGHHDVFAVRATGNSMRDADIFDGDYVIAEEASLDEVRSGDKVVAVVDDMAVVKRIEKSPRAIVLHPENKSGKYHPIIISGDSENFKVVGRVIDVLHFSEPEDIEFIPVNN